MMENISNRFYVPEDTLKIQIPKLIKSKCPLKPHIQILHCGINHWVCTYYDSMQIYLYDSLNARRLRAAERTFLERLFPQYDFKQNPVLFPRVQQ